jgi:putative membrane protein
MNSNKEFTRSNPYWIWLPLIFVAGIVTIVAIAGFGAFHAGGYYPMYFFPWWILFPLFFFGIFFLTFRWCGWGYWGSSRARYHYDDNALEVLRERFARGELNKEQYDQMRKDLEAF